MTDKAQRQAATARMTRCRCGNVAKQGEALCGACQDVLDREDSRVANVETVLDAVEDYITARMSGDDGKGERNMLRDALLAVLP